METNIWIEILKLLGPSTIVGIIVGYVFNRKLEKTRAFSKVNEVYLTSVVTGINEFIGSFKMVLEKLNEVDQKFRSHSEIDKETFEDIQNVINNYRAVVRTHRVYLAPFLPFGNSYEDAGMNQIINILSSIEILHQGSKFGASLSELDRRDIVAIFLRSTEKLNERYASMAVKAEKVLSDIHHARPIMK